MIDPNEIVTPHTEHPRITPESRVGPLTPMIQNLQILNSSYVGSRDLWWTDVPEATHGYNIYRAFDYPTNWVKLTTVPLGGHFYRDMTSLTEVIYDIQSSDWIEQGQLGRWIFRIPDPPFSRAVQGRPVISNDPTDVLVTVSVSGNFDDAQTFRPAKVDGFDRTVWLKMDNTLPTGGAVTALPLISNGVAQSIITTSISSDVLFVTMEASGTAPPLMAGQVVTLEDTQESFLNGQSVTVLSSPAPTSTSFSASFPAANYINNEDTGVATGQIVWKANWSGISAFRATYYKVNNLVDIYTELNRTYYTVVPIKDGHEVHPPGAIGTVIKNTQEVDQITWEYEEMVRRNQWIFEEVGEPAYLLFRKWRGIPCGCTTGLHQPKTGCRTCYETGFVGGYIGPYDMLFVPPDSAILRELNEGGIKTTRDSRSFLTRTPIVQNGDLIVRRNGDRNVISNVVYKMPRGIILQQDFSVSLLSPGDTRYLIPLNTSLPTLFNPVVRPDPLDGKGGGEPLFDPRTVPGKDWENVNVQIGRTITFGKIQT